MVHEDINYDKAMYVYEWEEMFSVLSIIISIC